jgi:hypothetical protein
MRFAGQYRTAWTEVTGIGPTSVDFGNDQTPLCPSVVLYSS